MNDGMMHDEAVSDAGGGFAVGLLCGVAVGAAVALLVTPKSGAELRGQMSDVSHRLGRRARDGYEKAKDAYERTPYLEESMPATSTGAARYHSGKTRLRSSIFGRSLMTMYG